MIKCIALPKRFEVHMYIDICFDISFIYSLNNVLRGPEGGGIEAPTSMWVLNNKCEGQVFDILGSLLVGVGKLKKRERIHSHMMYL